MPTSNERKMVSSNEALKELNLNESCHIVRHLENAPYARNKKKQTPPYQFPIIATNTYLPPA